MFRDRLGTGVETIRDRCGLHLDCKAGIAVHVRPDEAANTFAISSRLAPLLAI
jgi:hypothetical protein